MTTEQPYTPSMDEARGRYSDGATYQGVPEPYPGAHLDAWDRFIAQVRRDAAKEGYRQGYNDRTKEHSYDLSYPEETR